MLYFIPTPIGNLNDISFHSLEILQKCKLFLCEDTRVCKSLIHLLNEKFSLEIKPDKYIALHTHNEKDFLAKIDENFFDQDIAYLSDAGMPGISDPGQFLVDYAIKHHIQYEVLPGSNAALLALVSSALCQKEFIFMGFLANKNPQRQKDIERLMLNPYPSIVYEAPTRILNLVEEISKIDSLREIFIIKEATKKFETKLRSSALDVLKCLKTMDLRGEWCVVVNAKEKQFHENTLCEQDIYELDLPLKAKAKLLSKINAKSPKENYQKLLLS
ncbi:MULTISPECIES: 16S rRNA (cytidine(1402)-2'-O)-methyltransferase [unclassified Campylobacter]|uniref:16S rRNA (cytidine(1402)-2'-O)-methyltransferase n=1 Tax=unclassified Campylobacter TaxID=2593542 RepID=UPI000EA96EDB|nr:MULTISPECIES: 16S rRNA (cytidine(1402)-2'-O)-methyltransferase [unclassified Campylobacter]QOR01053.1 16S rRNA (cytidine(1402)-2'-O)-methyltransferase [Campylobacter sp. 2014D-0216]RKO64777.1 16S rRNA (cytidine(1402)-2'-O)-methyltransferase [Campylobacter sp. P255]